MEYFIKKSTEISILNHFLNNDFPFYKEKLQKRLLIIWQSLNKEVDMYDKWEASKN